VVKTSAIKLAHKQAIAVYDMQRLKIYVCILAFLRRFQKWTQTLGFAGC
jgi:hypothetical protein